MPKTPVPTRRPQDSDLTERLGQHRGCCISGLMGSHVQEKNEACSFRALTKGLEWGSFICGHVNDPDP